MLNIDGHYVSVVPLDAAAHSEALWNETGGAAHASLWTWMHHGPFPERAPFDADVAAKAASFDPCFHAIIDRTANRPVGYASLMRMDPANRVIEIGGIVFGPSLQRTRGATEALYLMMSHVFENLRYRRCEWKCNALNEPSRAAALRLGFTFEGIFRQHMLVKGKNRDTAWFSVIDSEWPARREALERWLRASNFDETGKQKTRLERAN